MIVAHNNLGDAGTVSLLSSGSTVKGPKYRMVVANATLTPAEEELRKATLARDYDAMFTRNGVPFSWPKNVPLGKYSFVERDGVRHYVPFTAADIERFARSPYAKIKKGYKCPDKRLRGIIKNRADKAAKAARNNPSTDPRHIRHIFPGRLFCRPREDSPLEKIAIGAAVVTAGVIFGPQILAGAKSVGKGAIAAGGKLAGSAAKAAPLAETVINGKAVTDAVKSGQMPPPPISLGDGALTDYAEVVGQRMLERDLGRAATAQEMQQLAYMIEQQRQLMAAQERPHAPVVNTGLDPALTHAQKGRADAANSTNTILKLLAVAVPVGLVLMRA